MARRDEPPSDSVQANASPELGISEQELIQALEEASQRTEPGVDGFIRRAELQRIVGWSRDKLLAELHALSDAGRLECRNIPMRDITGRMTRVPGYRLKHD